MRRLTALTLILLLAAAAASAQGAGVVQSACSIMQVEDGYRLSCFAQVHNDQDVPVRLESGMLEVLSGEDCLALVPVGGLAPYFVSAGGDGYLSDMIEMPGSEIAPQVTAINYILELMDVDPLYDRVAMTADAVISEDAYDESLTVTCVVHNDTQADAWEPIVALGLYTQGGAMVYADSMTLDEVGIPAGSSLLARFEVPASFVRQWKDYQAMPEQAVVSASYSGVMD